MKATYLKLENVAGLMIGSSKSCIEIDFTKSHNTIIGILASNGSGKTTLLSSISPFSGVTSLDERSTLSYILPKKDGYKEIHYLDGNDKYIIKHYYKAKGEDSHTVKSYFSLNDEELNENGNVTSFLSLVETYFELTPDMMRLIRLGTNVSSIITLQSAKRKEYIGKLISEIDAYLNIYKGINDDLRVIKSLISTNANNLYNCHITDILVEKDKLKDLDKEIKKSEKEKDRLVGEIGKINALIKDNNIEDLRKKKSEAETSLHEFSKTEDRIKVLKLESITLDSLIQKRSDLSNEKIDIQSKINSYRISIDNALRSIEKLEISIKRITSDNDIQSLMNIIESLRNEINNTNKIITSFTPINGLTSTLLEEIIGKLRSFNQISQMIYTFGNKPVEVYLRLKDEKISVDTWLKNQIKNNLSRLNENDIKALLDQVFQDDDMISPACEDEFQYCPYYRLSNTITKIRDKLEEESFNDETLRYIQVISNNIDNILNDLDKYLEVNLPDYMKDSLKEKSIISNLRDKKSFFELSSFTEYLSILKEYEIYRKNIDRLKEYEYQLSIYKKSGIDSQLNQINEFKESIEFYKNNINSLNNDLKNIDSNIEEMDSKISLVTKYQDSKKYKKMFESTLEATNKILEPLENASNEKRELEYELRSTVVRIDSLRTEYRSLEQKINDYNRLLEEGEKLQKKNNDLNLILKATSTKKGIPVIYIKRYLGKIKNLANNLLQIIYDDDFKLAKFNITQDSFEIPYIKNGRKVPDVKYASQSEVAFVTMALSFALVNMASGKYNILLLDEIDAGLDESNRSGFLKMLYMQMNALKVEQVFMISQNISQMINVPMDCIKLGNFDVKSKLQIVIYE